MLAETPVDDLCIVGENQADNYGQTINHSVGSSGFARIICQRILDMIWLRFYIADCVIMIAGERPIEDRTASKRK
jgi:hypothetical protein